MDTFKTGKFLQDLRKENNLTQEELGEKLGVTNKTISRWETGTYIPPVDILIRLSEIYNVTVNELLSGERLSTADYKPKAEENIVTTLHNNSVAQKRSKNKLIVCIAIITVLVILGILLLWGLSSYRKQKSFFTQSVLEQSLVPDLPKVNCKKSQIGAIGKRECHFAITEKEFDDYVVIIYEYLKSLDFTYFGSRGEVLNTFFGGCPTYELRVVNELSDFIYVTKYANDSEMESYVFAWQSSEDNFRSHYLELAYYPNNDFSCCIQLDYGFESYELVNYGNS